MTAMCRSTLAVILALAIQACTEWQTYASSATQPEVDCEYLFQEMDRTVGNYGVADAATARIADFPELRVDRFLASYANENLSVNAYSAWLERLRHLDATARKIEWSNLPSDAKIRMRKLFGPNIEKSVAVCGHILMERDLLIPSRRAQLLDEVEEPDAYSAWQRIFGLYYLTRWAIAEGVWQVQREMRQPFIEARQANATGTRSLSYAPHTGPVLDQHEVSNILAQSARNPLAIPEPSERQLAYLFSTFAPIWIVETANDNDRIGKIRMDKNGKPEVDTQEASVYLLASQTRFGGRVLLQLNYMIWFPARTAEGLLDIYAGRFDGLIWRVTLNPDGTPLAYDSIHPCGCYYQIFPGRGMRVVQPQDGSEPILSPMPILGIKSDERLTIKITTRTHFIDGVGSGKPEPTSLVYAWLDYDDLRSLPMPNGERSSLFGTDGLIRDSERPERFLLWPMGVPSAGAMRQWGTHAIAFLGKRHFDDPWLFEKLLRPLRE